MDLYGCSIWTHSPLYALERFDVCWKRTRRGVAWVYCPFDVLLVLTPQCSENEIKGKKLLVAMSKSRKVTFVSHIVCRCESNTRNASSLIPRLPPQSLKSTLSTSDPTSSTATLTTESCLLCLPNPNGLRDFVIPMFAMDIDRLARSRRASSCA